MSSQAEAMTERVEAAVVTRRLENTYLSWWLFSVLTAGALAASSSLAALFTFAAIDAAVPLPRVGLAVLFGIWVVLTACLAAFVITPGACARPDSFGSGVVSTQSISDQVTLAVDRQSQSAGKQPGFYLFPMFNI